MNRLILLWQLTACLSVLTFFYGLRLNKFKSLSVSTYENQMELIEWLQKCEEKLMCGIPLEENDFKHPLFIKNEYAFISHFIQSLRESGQPLLSTLKSLKETILFVSQTLQHSHAKTSPAKLQSKVSIILVMVVSILLYFLLETPKENSKLWFLVTMGALLIASYSFIWIEKLILKTLYNGSKNKSEKKWLSFFLFPEKLCGGIQMGRSLEEVWMEHVAVLRKNEEFPEDLFSIWTSRSENEPSKTIEIKMIRELKEMIQNALFHGTQVSERIHIWKLQARIQFQSELNQRLETLPHRCLLPLYCCVAPAVLGLLVFGLFLEVQKNVNL